MADKHLHPMKGYHAISNPLAEQKMIRGSISDIVDKKTTRNGNYCLKKPGVLVKNPVRMHARAGKEALTSNQFDSVIYKMYQVGTRTCAIAFVTLDGKLSTVFKRWYPDIDSAVEERPVAASSPASLYSRLSAL